ncbi:Fc receptor-like A isoform X1 [Fukomys damarensis]|uniref:Fc receptor-like A n=1 Tax=Fukomys damarensis TaxID=885580 RepID=A0A091E6J9_FUKDA|nr:Fc receptor-like A isoform X1 [Fukomys damarensis]KFO38403.1 Fc receptor-like A [Fukomys damarensis]
MKLGYALTAWALYLSPAMLWAVPMLPATASFSGCPSSMASSAAILEILECGGSVSTKESSCLTNDDGTSTEEAGFQLKGYTFSEPFHLIVSYDWLILQGPAAPIFEGDPLVLHCRAWQDWPLTQVTFYRDGSALGPPRPNREFSIAVVQEADSGHYHCSGIFRSPGPRSPETASPVTVTVQERFPAPVLRASPSAEPHEGSPVTLSCQTKLSPQRSATRLFFSFYKDGKKVRSRDLSSEFQILTASLEHSGSYWCEAATEDSQVWKLSPRLEVRVQGPSTSAASPTFNPVSQRSVAPETRADPPEPVPPLATPTSEPPVFSSPDPHLHHRMGILLKHTQDIRDLLGYLLVELRDLSGRLKPKTTEPPAK